MDRLDAMRLFVRVRVEHLSERIGAHPLWDEILDVRRRRHPQAGLL